MSTEKRRRSWSDLGPSERAAAVTGIALVVLMIGVFYGECAGTEEDRFSDRSAFARSIENHFDEGGLNVDAELEGGEGRTLRVTFPACDQEIVETLVEGSGEEMREIGIREVVCDTGGARNYRARP